MPVLYIGMGITFMVMMYSDFRRGPSEELEAKYKAERIRECKELLGWEVGPIEEEK